MLLVVRASMEADETTSSGSGSGGRALCRAAEAKACNAVMALLTRFPLRALSRR